MADANRTDLPTIEDETREYWDAAAGGLLLIARCGSCERVHHYPRVMCPFCWSEDVTAVEASGRATLYTYSTVYVNDLPPFSGRLPYTAAVVDLAEGPRLMTTVVDAEPSQLRIGMPLLAEPREVADGVTTFVFRPA
ncbi:MAG TPA: Zn-ribbon domain-containing OB-fold protein [Trebonia sp.]